MTRRGSWFQNWDSGVVHASQLLKIRIIGGQQRDNPSHKQGADIRLFNSLQGSHFTTRFDSWETFDVAGPLVWGLLRRSSCPALDAPAEPWWVCRFSEKKNGFGSGQMARVPGDSVGTWGSRFPSEGNVPHIVST